jgi:hypothetical protein
MKVYIIAATLGEYQDALRQLGLHERAAVHVTPRAGGVTSLEPWPPQGPAYLYRFGTVIQVYLPAEARAA